MNKIITIFKIPELAQKIGITLLFFDMRKKPETAAAVTVTDQA